MSEFVKKKFDCLLQFNYIKLNQTVSMHISIKGFLAGKRGLLDVDLETSRHIFFKAGIVRSCAHLRAASALELDNTTGKEHACSNVRAAIRFLPTTAQLNLESP